jgi:hypothetical protein
MCIAAMARTFEHPGILNTQSELEHMKAMVNQSEYHPMQEGWKRLRQHPVASLSFVSDPIEDVKVVQGYVESEVIYRDAAFAAYAHALQWVVTDDDRHRDKALQVLNDWGGTFRQMYTDSKPQQVGLEASWVLPIWVEAAEIMKHYNNGAAGWKEADIAQFDKMIDHLNSHAASRVRKTDHNQVCTGVAAALSYAIYRDDQDYYTQNIEFFKEQIKHYIRPTDGWLQEPGWPHMDENHADYGMTSLVQAAEMAWHQGDDIYAYKGGHSEPLLLAGVNYLAEFIQSDVAPKDNLDGAVWEIALNHYKNRAGESGLALMESMIHEYDNRPQGISEVHMPGWSTLTHAELDSDAASFSPYVAPMKPGRISLPTQAVSSSVDEAGVIAGYTSDDNLTTRWSFSSWRKGDVYIQYDLKNSYTVTHLMMAFYKGHERTYYFDIWYSNDGEEFTKLHSGKNAKRSHGGLKKVDIDDTRMRYLRIHPLHAIDHKDNKTYWVHYKEVEIYHDGDAVCPWGDCDGEQQASVHTPEISPAGGTIGTPTEVKITCQTDGADIRYTTDGTSPDESSKLYDGAITVDGTMTITARAFKTDMLPSFTTAESYTFYQLPDWVNAISASSDDGNVAGNAVDGDLSTRWSANGDGQWVQIDLGTSMFVDSIGLAYYRGDQRSSEFDILAGPDTASLTPVLSGQNSSGTTTALEWYELTTECRFIRIVGHGNSSSGWNSIAEVAIGGNDMPTTGRNRLAGTGTAVQTRISSFGDILRIQTNPSLYKGVQIVSLSGRVVATHQISDSSTNLSTQGISPGNYVVYLRGARTKTIPLSIWH